MLLRFLGSRKHKFKCETFLREWVLNEFKKGSTAILVATDVAARYFSEDLHKN